MERRRRHKAERAAEALKRLRRDVRFMIATRKPWDEIRPLIERLASRLGPDDPEILELSVREVMEC